jgi:sigma-B regulation protein RsbU (phosphoserine phosphatase)
MNMVRGEVSRVPLLKGDRLLVYTDGLIELSNEKGEMYGESRLRDLFASCANIDIEETSERLKTSFDSFKGSVLAEDDITALLIEF